MSRSLSLFQFTARLAVLLPFAVLGSACGGAASDESMESGDDAGTGSDPGARNEGGSGNDGGNANGGDGGSGGDGGDGGGGNDGAVVVTPDTTPPTVLSSYPGIAAMGVSPGDEVTVTFSEAMGALTLTTGTTFTVTRAGVTVPGNVTAVDNAATFTPTDPLDLDTTYRATISTAAKDLADNPLAAAFTWTFKTNASAPDGPSPVLLGAAGKYVVLAKSAITNVPISKVTGNVAISPAAASYITGFSMTKAGTFWTSPQVTGRLFAADNDAPTPSNLTTAIGNMETAYTDAAGRPTPTFLNLGGGAIGGSTLTPGLYKWTSTVTIPGNVVISGGANDVWIFQITGDLMMSASKSMTLSGGAKAKNIFWQVAGLVDLGTSAHAEGIMLSKTAIKLGTGASVNGRLLAQTAVTLAGSTVTAPAQ